jgi:hypothetical protein
LGLLVRLAALSLDRRPPVYARSACGGEAVAGVGQDQLAVVLGVAGRGDRRILAPFGDVIRPP